MPVSPPEFTLSPGLYFLRYDNQVQGYHGPFTLVVSNVNLTVKINSTEAFLWAVDLRTGEPVAGASVSIYDSLGTKLAEGQTGEDGVLLTPIPVQQDPYQTYFAILGQPGEDRFGLALSTWAQGISPDYFGIHEETRPPGLLTYLYTDRPIYRPGQTVYFRAVTRQAYNGFYSLPESAHPAGLHLRWYGNQAERLRPDAFKLRHSARRVQAGGRRSTRVLSPGERVEFDQLPGGRISQA